MPATVEVGAVRWITPEPLPEWTEGDAWASAVIEGKLVATGVVEGAASL